MPHCANCGPAHMKVGLVSSLFNPRVFSIVGGLALLTQSLPSILFLSKSRYSRAHPQTQHYLLCYTYNLMMH